MSGSKIILTNDYEALKDELVLECGINSVKFFQNSDILLDDAKAAAKEAYIAENSLKTIVLIGNKFGIEAQNSLLLLLEEPPKNIRFILISSSKNSFLPTIRSRLLVENRLKPRAQEPSGLDLKKLDLKAIDKFIDEKMALEKSGEFGKNELKNMISSIFKEALESGIKFDKNELEHIKKLMILASLNAKARVVLTPLLLMIGEKI
ncbi:DNA polymerase III subunit delta' [Campylobacter geochelonis]|uniref:DNA polymerase III subunit delta' n=1 Tax=Campylobacter geochelonis TaxID=1780362 RepID=UPI0007706E8F|nr:DNA polymerase III subunit delta' [Campylobacter geochelonis]CZE47658.1 DNA polymerase III subunit delta' [Campylobacter geochelonis]CZE50156.1 DNA polymerase III subunit delta' [Campylobacter geochelonis]